MEKELLIAAILGVLLYFGLEFKSKGFKWADFKGAFWVKDNWFNLVLSGLAIYTYVYIKDGISKEIAFAIGFAGNKAIDYLQDLKDLYFKKST